MVSQVRHKMIPTVLLPSKQFCFRVYLIDVLILGLNQRSARNKLERRHRAVWALHAFQVGLSASPYLVNNADICFKAEKNWGRE